MKDYPRDQRCEQGQPKQAGEHQPYRITEMKIRMERSDEVRHVLTHRTVQFTSRAFCA